MQVREAERTDVDALVQFNLRMAMETERKQLDREVLTAGVRAVLDHPALGFYLVAEAEGKVVGCLMVTTEWSDWRNGAFWWVQSVYVVPPFRRRGAFRALYAEVKRRARKAGNVRGFRLYVERDNAVAQSTYSRLGMAETHYRVFEELL
jgi:GNAT superfamily N-acetyltransferase